MKEKMYSKQSNTYLHHHIIDGFEASHQGIKNLKQSGMIPEQEYTALLENAQISTHPGETPERNGTNN